MAESSKTGTHMETTQLATLIAAKHDVLVQLQQIMREESQIENNASLAHIEVAVHRKKTLVDELLSLEAQLNPFRDQDPESRVWESPAAREQCRQTEVRCCAMLSEILAHEKKAEAALIERREETASQLQQSRAATQARNAYRSSTQPRSGGLNLSSG